MHIQVELIADIQNERTLNIEAILLTDDRLDEEEQEIIKALNDKYSTLQDKLIADALIVSVSSYLW